MYQQLREALRHEARRLENTRIRNGPENQMITPLNSVIRLFFKDIFGGREGFELGRVTFQISKLLMRIHARIPTDPPKPPYLPPDLPPEPSCKMTGLPVRRYRLRIQL